MNLTDSETTDLPCVIIAGGLSKRFGSTKACAILGDKTLTRHMINRVKCQTQGAIAINSRQSLNPSVQVSAISDILDGEIGPLAGLHSAISWASDHGHSSVLTTPVDAPFFPKTLAKRLEQKGACAVAKYGNQLHPLFGIWDVVRLAELESAIIGGVRSMHAWVRICEAGIVDFSDAPAHAFFNINTPEDLAEAERLLNTAQ